MQCRVINMIDAITMATRARPAELSVRAGEHVGAESMLSLAV
jgi:hypothetical protein